VEAAFARHGSDIAAVIVEPVCGNMGCVAPRAGYLQALRDTTRRAGTVLVFDEVMTGFRLARGGAQEIFGITPDLTCLGKIIGGGLPAAAYGGRAEIMDLLRPSDTYERLEALSARLHQGLERAVRDTRTTACINRVGSMITLFFCAGPVVDYATAKASDTARFGRFFHALLERGVYLPPAQFEAAFVSLAHTEADIDETVRAAEEALRAISRPGA
jgi:glutamate-1-semialdehyde 2,1-aminomutase